MPVQHHLTLIAYRPNKTDYCKGCAMDSSGSEMEIVYSDDLHEIVEKVIDFEEFDANMGREYAPTEITVLLNGFELDGYDLDEDQMARNLYDDYYALLPVKRAQRQAVRATENEAKAKEAERLTAAKAIKDAADQQERDLQTLARLKAKYETV